MEQHQQPGVVDALVLLRDRPPSNLHQCTVTHQLSHPRSSRNHQHSTHQHYSTAQHTTAQRGTARHTAPHSTTQRGTQHHIAPHLHGRPVYSREVFQWLHSPRTASSQLLKLRTTLSDQCSVPNPVPSAICDTCSHSCAAWTASTCLAPRSTPSPANIGLLATTDFFMAPMARGYTHNTRQQSDSVSQWCRQQAVRYSSSGTAVSHSSSKAQRQSGVPVVAAWPSSDLPVPTRLGAVPPAGSSSSRHTARNTLLPKMPGGRALANAATAASTPQSKCSTRKAHTQKPVASNPATPRQQGSTDAAGVQAGRVQGCRHPQRVQAGERVQ